MTTDASASSGHFRIRFRGEFSLQSPLVADGLHIAGKTQEIFAFLLLKGNNTVRRTTLTNLAWSDRDERQSRANLNTALWRINRALNIAGNHDIRLDVSGHQVRLRVAPSVFIDVSALEASVLAAARSFNDGRKALLPADIRDSLIDILSDDCDGFLESWTSEWVLIERERFFNLQIRGLTLIMQDLAESGRIDEALDYGRRILRMDPMRECVQRQVMWLHVLHGHQGNAIRQYLECARILEQELGVSPMPETRALYDFIVAHNAAAVDLEAGGRRGSGGAPMERTGCEHAPAGYDAELDRLRSLMSRLNSHRQSVFSALADSRAS